MSEQILGVLEKAGLAMSNQTEQVGSRRGGDEAIKRPSGNILKP